MPFAKIHPAIHANARPVRRALLAVCLNFCLCLAPSAAVALNNPWQIASTWGAVNSQGPIELANNNATQAAVAWNPCPINMNSSFDLSFTMNFGINQGLCGGDGMSFILQAATNGSPFANGTAGINGEKGFVGIQNSLEVAFDNYPGGYSGWPAYSNIGILTNGDPENSDSDVTGCGIQGAGPKVTGPCFPAASYVAPDIRDGLNHTVEIKWNPSFSLLTVVVDNNPSPPSWTLQNPATYFNGQTSVYFGIGASAGSAKNFQSFTYTGENGQSINCGAFPTPTAGAAPTAIVYGTPACVPTPQNTFTPAPTATAVPPTPTPWPTLCGPVPAFASGGQVPTGGCNNSPYTYAINNSPSGTNQLLVVSIWAATAPTGATYGGKAMTAQGPIVNNIQSWYVQAPPTGTNNLVFTYGGTQCSIFVAYAFYNNVNQTGSPLGTVVNQSNPSAKFSTDTITPSTAYSILQDFTTCSNGGGSITASNSTFIPGNTGDGSGHDLAGDYQSTNGKTPYSFSYSTANAGNWVGQTLEILPITSCITPTFTLTPTMTFTKSFTNTFTLTPTKSSTNTFTLTPTQSSTNTFTLTPTKSFTNTYTLTPTQTSTKTATNTFTQTSTPSLTNSFTFTPTQSSTRTATNTFTQTSTPSSTNSFTFTPTQSSTKTATNTFTPSDTASFSPTPTLSATQTPSKTATSTSTDSPTPSFSPTQSFTLTATPTFSDSPTPSFSPTASFTSTPTPTQPHGILHVHAHAHLQRQPHGQRHPDTILHQDGHQHLHGQPDPDQHAHAHSHAHGLTHVHRDQDGHQHLHRQQHTRAGALPAQDPGLQQRG
jgi:hypothetical protein